MSRSRSGYSRQFGQNQVRGVLIRSGCLYAGLDQVMTVTSGLASVLGLLLIFWNKVVGIFFKLVRKFTPLREPSPSDAPKDIPKELRKFSGVRFLRRKVIVIGLDGLEPGIVESMLERGDSQTCKDPRARAATRACKPPTRPRLRWPGRRS